MCACKRVCKRVLVCVSAAGKLAASLKSAKRKRENEEKDKGFFKKPTNKADESDDEEERFYSCLSCSFSCPYAVLFCPLILSRSLLLICSFSLSVTRVHYYTRVSMQSVT